MEKEPHVPAIEAEVTTEPQRQALNAMSQELTAKLHAMIAEQEARTRQFADLQHSTSAIPLATPHNEASEPAPAPAPALAATRRVPPPLATQSPADTPAPPQPTPLPRRPQQRKAQPTQQEGISGTTIIVIIIAIVLLLRACS